jgi:hypothetical protein
MVWTTQDCNALTGTIPVCQYPLFVMSDAFTETKGKGNTVHGSLTEGEGSACLTSLYLFRSGAFDTANMTRYLNEEAKSLLL